MPILKEIGSFLGTAVPIEIALLFALPFVLGILTKVSSQPIFKGLDKVRGEVMTLPMLFICYFLVVIFTVIFANSVGRYVTDYGYNFFNMKNHTPNQNYTWNFLSSSLAATGVQFIIVYWFRRHSFNTMPIIYTALLIVNLISFWFVLDHYNKVDNTTIHWSPTNYDQIRFFIYFIPSMIATLLSTLISLIGVNIEFTWKLQAHTDKYCIAPTKVSKYKERCSRKAINGSKFCKQHDEMNR